MFAGVKSKLTLQAMSCFPRRMPLVVCKHYIFTEHNIKTNRCNRVYLRLIFLSICQECRAAVSIFFQTNIDLRGKQGVTSHPCQVKRVKRCICSRCTCSTPEPGFDWSCRLQSTAAEKQRNNTNQQFPSRLRAAEEHGRCRQIPLVKALGSYTDVLSIYWKHRVGISLWAAYQWDAYRLAAELVFIRGWI